MIQAASEFHLFFELGGVKGGVLRIRFAAGGFVEGDELGAELLVADLFRAPLIGVRIRGLDGAAERSTFASVERDDFRIEAISGELSTAIAGLS